MSAEAIFFVCAACAFVGFILGIAFCAIVLD